MLSSCEYVCVSCSKCRQGFKALDLDTDDTENMRVLLSCAVCLVFSTLTLVDSLLVIWNEGVIGWILSGVVGVLARMLCTVVMLDFTCEWQKTTPLE